MGGSNLSLDEQGRKTVLKKITPISSIILLGALVCSDCSILSSKADQPTSVPTVIPEDDESEAPSKDAEAQTDEPEFSSCPDTDWTFWLDYKHDLVLKQEGSFNISMHAREGSAFMLTIHGNGFIDGDDFDNRIPISITGEVGDCVIIGENMLHADIIGVCKDGIATIGIFEKYQQGHTFLESCPEGQFLQGVDRMVSAPEVEYVFDFSKDEDTKVIDTDFGYLSIYYSWTLRPAGPGIVPLAPPN
jgi:hypothetical protein